MGKWFTRWLYWLLLVIGALGALLATVLWQGSSAMLCPPRAELETWYHEFMADIKSHGISVKPLSVTTADGYKTPLLVCEPLTQLSKSSKGQVLRDRLQSMGVKLTEPGTIHGTVIILHAHKSRKENFLGVAERFCAVGFRCIMPDLPGHGEHPAPYTTYGLREAGLPAQWADGVSRDLGVKLGPCYLFGYSMGGAVALHAAGLEPQRWTGVVTVAAFAELDEAVANSAAARYGSIAPPLHTLVRPVVQWRADFDPREVSTVKVAAGISGPRVMILHGDQDLFVPPHHAQRIFQALPAARKELLLVPGAAHSNVLLTDAPVYAQICKHWLTP
jgi:uncharacterized protein